MTQPLASSESPPPASISFRREAKSGILIARWRGVMTDAVMLSHYRRCFSAPEYDPTCRELADLRHLSGNQLTTEGLKKLAALAERYRRSGLSAIVSQDDLSFGLGRMYNVFGPDGSRRIEVFRDLASALKWLGVDQTEIPAFESDPAD